jgi:hypothetical protein
VGDSGRVIFNFHFGNHDQRGLNALTDLVLPIYYGLIEAGHEVLGFGTDAVPAPAVNVFIENFNDGFTDTLLQRKAANRDGFRFGILCTEDIADALVMETTDSPRRRDNLKRLLPQADFVWTLLPQPEFFASACRPGTMAVVKYGFTEAYLDPYPIRDPGLRDVDVMLYGNSSPYREKVAGALRQRGYTVFVSRRESWPSFMTDDLIRRSKVMIDMRRGPNVRFLSPTRIARGLHSGAAVVSEQFDASEIADLYQYTQVVPYDEIADRCTEIIQSRRYVELGAEAQARFRNETSMRDNMARALTPVLSRYA